MADPAVSRSFFDRVYYSAHFMDVGLWEPFVRKVCRAHGFDSSKVNPGVPGTYPTFVVQLGAEGALRPSGHVVVKFFGPLFNGEQAFKVERTIEAWLDQQSLSIASPAILADGQIEQDWRYLIFEHIPGLSIGQIGDELSRSDWLSVAYQVGEFMRQLHTLNISQLPVVDQLIRPTWDGFASFLSQQREICLANHRVWDDLPVHLLDQLETYVLPVEQLIDFSSQPHLIHADLTADHLLGRVVDGGWQSQAIIDWGDAMTGNLLYELVAIVFDLFKGDKDLLRECLDAYNLPDFYQQEFPRKALSMVLLHPFPMPAWVHMPHQDIQTLDDLAECLFGI